ncbi:MAG: alpha/beta fold hydrolase [bacterium]|nr:alpha/beta fold hydrolase [bacterium]
MHKIRVNGTELAYHECGEGPETVVFSHSYLVDHRQFSAQIEALEDRYRVIAFDHREHGQSALVETDYSLDDLVDDATALIERTGAGPCHFVGLSTGGFVGLRLALRSPHLLRSLVLMDTSAELEPALKRLKYETMFQILRVFGFGPLMGSVMGLMFSPAFLNDPKRQDEVDLWRKRMRANDRRAIVRFGRAIFKRDDVLPDLGAIETPTLVIVGADDRPQPSERARRIADGIPGAELMVIPNAGHLSTIDAPDAVNNALITFFAELWKRTVPADEDRS